MATIMALGAWNWMILAAILFVLELTAPGIFFMWFGFAAAVTGRMAVAAHLVLRLVACRRADCGKISPQAPARKRAAASERARGAADRPVLRSRRSHREWARLDQDRRYDLAGGRARIGQRRPNQSGRCRRHSAQGRCGRQRSRRLTASSFDFLNRGDLVGDIGARIIVRP